MPIPVSLDIVSTAIAKVRPFSQSAKSVPEGANRSVCLLFSVHSSPLKMIYSDYVKQGILVYYRCKNCVEIGRCLTEEGYLVNTI